MRGASARLKVLIPNANFGKTESRGTVLNFTSNLWQWPVLTGGTGLGTADYSDQFVPVTRG